MPFSISFSRRLPAPGLRRREAPLDLDDTLKIYEVFRDYLKHEDDLRSTRTGWLLTSQAFLFAAIGTVLTSKDGVVPTIGFYVEAFIAALGFLIAYNHSRRASQQDKVYNALEANYREVRERLSAGPSGALGLRDLPPLRYAGANTTIGAAPYSVSYHALFMLAWLVLIGLLAAANWHVPAALFPSPAATTAAPPAAKTPAPPL